MAINTMGFTGRLNLYPKTLLGGSQDLIARARRGDEEASQLIFERYARPIASFIYDMVGQAGLAEELMQETFVRAFSNLHKLNDVEKPSTWLFGIARNVVRESRRASYKDSYSENDVRALAELQDNEISPDQQLINKELNQIILDALGRLDEDKRTVFTLKVFRQLSYEEIAAITGFSITKIKTDMYRARTELRRRVRPYLEGRK